MKNGKFVSCPKKITPKMVKGYVKKRVPDEDKKTKDLKAKAVRIFNEYIRERDLGQPCISSGRSWKPTDQCGHFFSAGSYPGLMFNEDNCHSQSLSDNYFKSGNLLEYRKNLEKKIGTERLKKLDDLAARWKGKPCHQNRFYYLEVIAKYRVLTKELKLQRESEHAVKMNQL